MQSQKPENFLYLALLTSQVELTQFSVESSCIKLKIWAIRLELSWKCEQLDSISIWVQNVNSKLNSMISLDLAQRMKISMIFFSAFSNYLVYSFMHQRFISWFDNDFNICSLRILMNFFSFIVFQLQRDFRADSLQTLKSIIVCIDRWSEKFFISSSISHHINWFIMSSVVKIKFIVIWDFW